MVRQRTHQKWCSGVEITFEDDVLVSLTDMWKADGSVVHKHPTEWRRKQTVQRFIEQIQEELRVGKSRLIHKVKGKGKDQGTFAHWKTAVQSVQVGDPFPLP